MSAILAGAVSIAVISIIACGGSDAEVTPDAGAQATPDSGSAATEEGVMSFSLVSEAFAEGQQIPVQYTCAGTDFSPPLDWNEVPAGTQAFALILDDPDAPGGAFTHWVLFNFSGNNVALAEGLLPPRGA